MRIGVTGGAGFVGANFVRQAVIAGHDVLNFDALTASATLSDIWDLEDVPNYSLVPGNINDEVSLTNAFAAFQPDVVVHLAHHGPHALADDHAATYLATNVVGLETVLQVSEQVGVRRVILSHHHLPPSISRNDKFTASKQASVLVAQAYAAASEMDVVHSFAPSVFGPRQSPTHPISLTIQRLLDGRGVIVPNGPDTSMELVFVDDYAAGLLTLASEGATDVHHLIAGPRKIRPLGIARQISKALQEHFPEADTQFSDFLDVRQVAAGQARSNASVNGMDVVRGTMPFHRAIGRTVHWHMSTGLSNGIETLRQAMDQREPLSENAA